jgi:hypothetical protein
MALLDAATGFGKTITTTHKVFLPVTDPAVRAALTNPRNPPKDVHVDPKTHQWYQYQKVTQTPQQWWSSQSGQPFHPITDPNQLYSILVGAGYRPADAVADIRSRTGLGDWKPGKNPNYSANDLNSRGIDELRGIAQLRGFHGAAKIKSKQKLMDYIMAHNPGAANTNTTAPTP